MRDKLPPRSIAVTDDLLDAPDGAEVSIRYRRVGRAWEQIAVEAPAEPQKWPHSQHSNPLLRAEPQRDAKDLELARNFMPKLFENFETIMPLGKTFNLIVGRIAAKFHLIRTAAEQCATREALEAASEHHPEQYHTATGYYVLCECGQKFHHLAEQEDIGYAQWKQHIRSLSAPAQAAPSTTATFRPTDPRETYDVPTAPQPDYSIRFSTAEEAQRAATILAQPNDLPIGWPGPINLPQSDRLAETPTEESCAIAPSVTNFAAQPAIRPTFATVTPPARIWRREPRHGENKTPLFEAIWRVVKWWEIKENGVQWSVTANDVCGIIDSIAEAEKGELR